MDQMMLIWISNNVSGIKAKMGENGVTTVQLRPLIEITHDSTKRNKMEIIFKDDNTKYEIPNHKVLEEIYKMHMTNTELMLLMHQYCEANLSRC